MIDSETPMRRCYRCTQIKPLDEFVKDKSKSGGHKYVCCPCMGGLRRDRLARLKAEDPAKFREVYGYQRFRNYRISADQFQEMVRAQAGECAICRRTGVPLAIDHDHSCCPAAKTCGKCIRGLLCNSCNRGIGLLQDSRDVLVRAIEYLS